MEREKSVDKNQTAAICRHVTTVTCEGVVDQTEATTDVETTIATGVTTMRNIVRIATMIDVTTVEAIHIRRAVITTTTAGIHTRDHPRTTIDTTTNSVETTTTIGHTTTAAEEAEHPSAGITMTEDSSQVIQTKKNPKCQYTVQKLYRGKLENNSLLANV
jgi:hypothetical protein